MNTGLQDAHNLAWRLAWAIRERGKGGGGEERARLLLGSYSPERHTIATANTRLSLANYDKSCASARLLGVDPALAAIAVKMGDKMPLVPWAARKAAVNGLLDTGLAPLRLLRHPVSEGGVGRLGILALSELRVAALKSQVDNGESLSLLFPQDDLDFCYGGDTNPPAGVSLRLNGSSGGGPSTVLRVGARVPHVWLRLVSPAISLNPSSSVDGEPLMHHADLCSTVQIASRISREAQQARAVILLVLVSPSGPQRDSDCYAAASEDGATWSRELAALEKDSQGAVLVLPVVSPPSGHPLAQHRQLQEILQKPRHITTPVNASSLNTPDSGNNQASVAAPAATTARLHALDETGRFTRGLQDANLRLCAVALRPDGHVTAIAGLGCGASPDESRRQAQSFFAVARERFVVGMQQPAEEANLH